MKTTLDIPDELLRAAKAGEKPWMAHFGGLKDLKEENARINQIIRDEFEWIDPGMCR